MNILYEDNHLLIVSKQAGEIVQGDKSGDRTLADDAKAYIKAAYHKPGDVFLGLPHRLDRPTSGVVVLCRTSKALTRMAQMFRESKVEKTYHAIVQKITPEMRGNLGIKPGEDLNTPHRLEHFLIRNEQRNKSYASCTARQGSKHAILEWREIDSSDRYSLLEVKLLTGRHHQIRCQLSAIGLPIKGDLKYGAPRSNIDGSICLHARSVSFTHPVAQKPVCVVAPYPALPIWQIFSS